MLSWRGTLFIKNMDLIIFLYIPVSCQSTDTPYAQIYWADNVPISSLLDNPFSAASIDKGVNISAHTFLYQPSLRLRWVRLRSRCQYFYRSSLLRAPRSDEPDDKCVLRRHAWCRNDNRYLQILVPDGTDGELLPGSFCRIVLPNNELPGGAPPDSSDRNCPPSCA